MDITFRKLRESDFPFLKKLYRTTREQELILTDWTEEQKESFIEFQFNAQHSHYSNSYDNIEFKIILHSNKPIGRLYLWETEHQLRIVDIALMPESTGKGIGTKILSSLIQQSEQSGKKLNIHVEYYNPALRLYERLGFEKTDDTGMYFFMERYPSGKKKQEL